MKLIVANLKYVPFQSESSFGACSASGYMASNQYSKCDSNGCGNVLLMARKGLEEALKKDISLTTIN